MRAIILIIQIRMWRIRTTYYRQTLPLLNITQGRIVVVTRIRCIPSKFSNDGHCFDTYNSFQGEICLVGETALEIIRGDLISGSECKLNEIVCPLFENGVVLGQISVVVGALGISEGHDYHVTTFFERHVFCAFVSLGPAEGRLKENLPPSPVGCPMARG